jgi:hypothetical protein
MPKYRNVIGLFGYKLNEALGMEQYVVELLKFKLDYYTARDVMEALLTYLDLCETETISYCYGMLDCFIEDVRFLDFSPLEIASAVIRLVSETTNSSKQSLSIFGISNNKYMNCYIVMKSLYVLQYKFGNEIRTNYTRNKNSKFIKSEDTDDGSLSTFDSIDDYFKRSNCQGWILDHHIER